MYIILNDLNQKHPQGAGGGFEEMEWRIRESSHGGFVASYGLPHVGGVSFENRPGVTMPAFIEYRSIRFETLKQAERYVAKQK